jgi:DNA adenine methylase
MRYFGGKCRLAPWVISHFPPHRIYVEPFGGAASVLMRKTPSYSEVYNDLDGEIVNVFRVLRDRRRCKRLIRILYLTPYAHDEFDAAYEYVDDPVEQARRTILRSFMGFGSAAVTKAHKTGFRSNSNRSAAPASNDWANYPDHVGAFAERLRGVVIENRDALEVMATHDRPDCLHYVDPPYVPSTRRAGSSRWCDGYRHEMDEEGHIKLLAFLQERCGMVVLSAYPCELYDATLQGWVKVEKGALADACLNRTLPRTEVLWLNPACGRAQATLFAEAAP